MVMATAKDRDSRDVRILAFGGSLESLLGLCGAFLVAHEASLGPSAGGSAAAASGPAATPSPKATNHEIIRRLHSLRATWIVRPA